MRVSRSSAPGKALTSGLPHAPPTVGLTRPLVELDGMLEMALRHLHLQNLSVRIHDEFRQT